MRGLVKEQSAEMPLLCACLLLWSEQGATRCGELKQTRIRVSGGFRVCVTALTMVMSTSRAM